MADPDPWASLPLWLQAGLTEAPPYSPPVGFEGMSPHERAAYRVRGGPPPNPQPVQTPEELGASALASLPMLVPGVGGLAARGIAAAPRLATALGVGGALGLGTGDAGEAADKVDPRLGEINKLEQVISKNNDLITKNTEKITTLGTTRTPSPKGTQERAIQSLNDANAQLRTDNKDLGDRLKQLRDEVETEVKAKERREMSWSESYPGAAAALGAAAPVASYVTGRLPGKKIASAAGAMGVGAAGGGIEGFMAAHAPTYLDSKLPNGAAKEAAQAKLRDWLTEVAPIAGMSALAGGYGAYRTALKGRPNIAPQNLPPPPAQSGTTQSLPTPPAPTMPSASMSGTPLASYPTPYFDKVTKRYRDPTTGNFVKKPPPE
jgi:hypothetical protein